MGLTPFQRLLPSTRDKFKNSIPIPKCRSKDFLDEVYRSSSDAINVRSMNQLPRGPSDLYNARHAAKKVSDPHLLSNQGSASENSSDTIWMLLQKAKRDESIAKSSIFIGECRVHPDFLVVLVSDCQLAEFWTNPQELSIFCADPTFIIFEDNISLTVTTYTNLKSENKATNQPHIGPLLMHQHKDWKTYSRFANPLIAEKMELDALLACGTDVEKALIDEFQLNFQFATLLPCFIHFKGNIKTELKNRIAPSNISFTCRKYLKSKNVRPNFMDL